MKKLIIPILALSFFFTGCETDDLILENEVTVSENYENKAIRRKRSRAPRREVKEDLHRINYKEIIDPSDFDVTVNSILIEYLDTEDVTPEPFSIIQEFSHELENGNQVYTNKGEIFNVDQVIGKPFLETYTYLDAEGNPIIEAQEEFVTIQDFDGRYAKINQFNRYADISTAELKLVYKGANIADIDSATVDFRKIKGFGPGKVPMTLIKRKFGTSHGSDVNENIENIDQSDSITAVIATVRLDYLQMDEYQEVFNTTGEISARIEVFSASGELLDDDTFYIEPEEKESISFKGRIRKKRGEESGYIRVSKKTGQFIDAAPLDSLVVSIPGAVSTIGAYDVRLDPIDGTDNVVFKNLLNTFSEESVGATFISAVTGYSDGEAVTTQEISFIVEEHDPVRNANLYTNGQQYFIESKVAVGQDEESISEVVFTTIDAGGEQITFSATLCSTNQNGVSLFTANVSQPENPAFEIGQDVILNYAAYGNFFSIVDEGSFATQVEEKGLVSIANNTHKIRSNGQHRIRVKLKNECIAQASYITVEIPTDQEDGALQTVNLSRIEGNENPVFQGTAEAATNVLNSGLVYNSPVTVFDAQNNILTQEVIEFTVD